MTNPLISRVTELKTETLKAVAMKAFLITTGERGDVLDAVLKELETRMPEGEFVSFCEGF